MTAQTVQRRAKHARELELVDAIESAFVERDARTLTPEEASARIRAAFDALYAFWNT